MNRNVLKKTENIENLHLPSTIQNGEQKIGGYNIEGIQNLLQTIEKIIMQYLIDPMKR